MEAEAASDAIAGLGLEFGLVSRETSLVAVDRTPSRPRGARLTEEELPLNLPHGWDFDALFGGDVPGGQGAREAGRADQAGARTAADRHGCRPSLMRNGALLLLLALAGLAALRRRKSACA